jgi:hypothetical protein
MAQTQSMSLELNRQSVPPELQADVEKIALDRFPGSSVVWVDENLGFIVLGIPEADYGSSQDINANGLPVGDPEPGYIAVISSLEEELKSFVRSQNMNP